MPPRARKPPVAPFSAKMRHQVRSQASRSVAVPAPIGGINAASPAAGMPITDCFVLKNLIPFQYGLRVRSGYREWGVGVGMDAVRETEVTLDKYAVSKA